MSGGKSLAAENISLPGAVNGRCGLPVKKQKSHAFSTPMARLLRTRSVANFWLISMAQPQYQQWLEDHLTHNPEDLHLQPAGKIYLAETPWFNISATIIRERLQNGESCEDLLPEPVLTYINQQGLYR